MKKVLVTDSVHPLLIQGLEKSGFECDYQPEISLSEVRRIITSYCGLIINSKILVDKAMLDQAPLLRFVGRLGSGMEIIDQVYAREKQVAVLSAPEGNRNAVAEQALGMLLALANNLCRADREVRQKIWEREKNRGFEIMGKTVGIVGFGHTGSRFASKLAGMEVTILAYDKYKKDYTADFPFVEEVTSEKLIKEADVISFHLPLTFETKNLVNDAFLTKCKKGVILINTSRGLVVNIKDLINALKTGQVAGACLDVFPNEKPSTFTPDEHQMYGELYAREDVILSPHVAGWTIESKKRLASVLLRKILEAVKRNPASGG